MNYNFIEIGTSDFNTFLQSCAPNSIGLSIEPIKLYLDNLPNVHGVTKLNCAISDFDGTIDIYWIDPLDIEKYNLPNWLRGCNSVNGVHRTAHAILTKHNLLNLYKVDRVQCLSWKTLVQVHQVKSIDVLKIDTEGHEPVILNQIAELHEMILPKTIIFESNELSNKSQLDSSIHRLVSLGYSLTSHPTSINQVLELL
jgi:FkbM family methyltransferase